MYPVTVGPHEWAALQEAMGWADLVNWREGKNGVGRVIPCQNHCPCTHIYWRRQKDAVEFALWCATWLHGYLTDTKTPADIVKPLRGRVLQVLLRE